MIIIKTLAAVLVNGILVRFTGFAMGKISKKKSGFYRFGRSIRLKVMKQKRCLQNSIYVDTVQTDVIKMTKQPDGVWRNNGKR